MRDFKPILLVESDSVDAIMVIKLCRTLTEPPDGEQDYGKYKIQGFAGRGR